MRLVLISPYHGGSHQAWADGYGRFSKHRVDLLAMPARFWKWRMHGAAVTLARRFRALKERPDLIMTTDMLDLTTFLSLSRAVTAGIPTVLYMHENQLTYPLPADTSTGPMRRQLGERDKHYAFINYASMLAADRIWFNSKFHLNSFYDALPRFLKHFPEYNELGTMSAAREKSEVVPVGIDLRRLDKFGGDQSLHTSMSDSPLIIWNQRWEYDKNPEAFFAALKAMAAKGVEFRLALCGQQFGKQPATFAELLQQLGNRIVYAGFAGMETYARLLWQADITVSTAHHEFFGISIIEAIYANTFPILPNRLSYPELIPDALQSACLYDDFPGLVDRLQYALENVQEIRQKSAAIAQSLTRFDWLHMAPKYDAGLSQLLL